MRVSETLKAVEQARDDVTKSQELLHQRAREAVAAGDPKARVARAAGVTRPTIYEWVKEGR